MCFVGCDNENVLMMLQDPKDNRLRTKNLLNRRLSKDMRPTPETMAIWGIIPDKDYFQDPLGAVSAKKEQQKDNRKKLARKYSQRSKPDELVARGLAYEHFLDDEAHNVERQRQHRLQQAKEKVAEKLNPKRRPSVIDLATHNIYPEDSEVVQELKQIALRHHRMQSAVDDLAKQLPFEKNVADITASNMMKHLVFAFTDIVVANHAQNLQSLQMIRNNDAKCFYFILFCFLFFSLCVCMCVNYTNIRNRKTRNIRNNRLKPRMMFYYVRMQIVEIQDIFITTTKPANVGPSKLRMKMRVLQWEDNPLQRRRMILQKLKGSNVCDDYLFQWNVI